MLGHKLFEVPKIISVTQSPTYAKLLLFCLYSHEHSIHDVSWSYPISSKYFLKDPFVLWCEILFSPQVFSRAVNASYLQTHRKPLSSWDERRVVVETLEFPRELCVSHLQSSVSWVVFIFQKISHVSKNVTSKSRWNGSSLQKKEIFCCYILHTTQPCGVQIAVTW